MATGETGLYAGIDDPNSLRTALAVLYGLREELDRHADGVHYESDRVAAWQLVQRRIEWATTRLAQLDAAQPPRQPVVVDPVELTGTVGTRVEQLTPIITAPTTATVGLSATELWMPPDGVLVPREHTHDVLVLAWHGHAVLVWWDQHGQPQQLTQRAGHYSHIPSRTPHTLRNTGDRPLIATRFHATSRADSGTIPRPDLQAALDRMQPPREDNSSMP